MAYVVYRFDVGGLERCVANLCNHLDRERFLPMVVCLDRSGTAAQWLERDDVEVVELHKRPGNDLGVVRRLARVLRDRGVGVVHSHNWGTLVETVLGRKWAGTAVHVHAERGTLLADHAGRGLRHRLRAAAMAWGLKRCDAVVSNARNTARRVETATGYPADRIAIIPNGVAAPRVAHRDEARAKVRRELGIMDGDLVVGSVGRLVEVKDFSLAIDALAEPVLSGRNIHLVLVGNGPERAALEARARQLQLSGRVHLAGHREDVGNWLAAMDVYVNTSVSEGMSQSIVEAMAAGLPCVVTDVGDSRALVDGEDACGIAVAAKASTELARAIVQLLDDPAVRSRLGGAARRRYESRYTLPAMIERQMELYDELVGRNERAWRSTPERVASTGPCAHSN